MESELFKPIIQVDNVTKTFGQGDIEVQALRGISLKVFKGEFVIIFGPSGSGKSTLLNIISGLDSVTTGKVTIDGVDLESLSGNERAKFHRDKVGIVFQAYNLIPTLSIRQNIALPLVFAGVPHEERRARADKLLEEFQLSSLANRLPVEASGGQQQRVGIMRALVANPPILIADEPTGNLDSKTSEDVMRLFRNLNQNLGVTLVVVTHDPTQFPWADRVIHVLDGKIIKQTIYHQKSYYSTFEETLEQRLDEGVDEQGLLPSQQPPEPAVAPAEQAAEQELPDETLIATDAIAGVPESEVAKEEEAEGGAEEEARRIVVLSGFERLWANRSRLSVEDEHILSMLNYVVDKSVLDQYSHEELLDMIQAIRLRIHDELTREELLEYLDKSRSKGGVGLNKTTANKLANMVEGMIKLFGYHKRHKDEKEEDVEEITPFDELWLTRTHFDKESEVLIKIIKEWLSEYQLHHLEKEQLLTLIQAIRERMAGVLQNDELYNILHQSVSGGGVGLYEQTARRLSDNINSLVVLFEMLRHQKRVRVKEAQEPRQVSGFEEVWANRSHLDAKNERILMMLGYLIDRRQKHKLSKDQILTIIQLVRYRMEGVITPEEFERYLDASEGVGSAHLYSQVARRLSREVESVIRLFGKK